VHRRVLQDRSPVREVQRFGGEVVWRGADRFFIVLYCVIVIGRLRYYYARSVLRLHRQRQACQQRLRSQRGVRRGVQRLPMVSEAGHFIPNLKV
jgi:hypothetical protein